MSLSWDVIILKIITWNEYFVNLFSVIGQCPAYLLIIYLLILCFMFCVLCFMMWFMFVFCVKQTHSIFIGLHIRIVKRHLSWAFWIIRVGWKTTACDDINGAVGWFFVTFDIYIFSNDEPYFYLNISSEIVGEIVGESMFIWTEKYQRRLKQYCNIWDMGIPNNGPLLLP